MEELKNEDIINAFRKLQTTVFYDKSNLILRHRIAKYTEKIKSDKDWDNTIINAINNINKDSEFNNWLEDMRIVYYPKKVSNPNKTDDTPSNFISNEIYDGAITIDRLGIFVDMPVELYIIDVLWVLKYGVALDGILSNCCYGNRLLIEKKVEEDGKESLTSPKGKWLYKRYIGQYQSWWGNGINKAEEVLHKDNEDVIIFTFDIKDYYHSIRFSYQELLSAVAKCLNIGEFEIKNDPVWICFEKIYEKYWELSKKSDLNQFVSIDDKHGPIPISLQSSPIIANWYLKNFDEYIKHEYNCLYYGRYVDDILFVLRKSQNEKVNDISCALKTYFHNIVNINETTNKPNVSNDKQYEFCENIYSNKLSKEANEQLQNHLKSLRFQDKKIFCYVFDKDTPSLILEKFVEEQRERSSEYRFMSDEMDTHLSSFDKLQLDTCFDYEDEAKGRFKNIEDNKFQISVFLSKFSKRLIEKGFQYRPEEVKKIFNFFKGIRIIEYYQFWEKILTLFVLAKRSDLFVLFVKNIDSQINKIKDFKDRLDAVSIVQSTMKEHLFESVAISLSYHIEEFKYIKNELAYIDIENIRSTALLYIESYMSRTHYNIWPMQQFMEKYKTMGVFMGIDDLEFLDLSVEKQSDLIWTPYYVKYYELVLAQVLSMDEKKALDYKEIQKTYCKINHFPNPQDSQWFVNDNNNGENNNPILYEVNDTKIAQAYNHHYLKDSNDTNIPKNNKGEISVSIVEMDVSKQILDEAINKTTDKPERTERMRLVLDKVNEVSGTDVVIMPELSMQVRSLMGFCRMSEKKQFAFISGLEYRIKNNKVYNQIITCIPIQMGYFRDAVPFIRNKNHFAPIEIESCEHRRLAYVERSHQDHATYALFHFKGHVFTSYYCFELANIRTRSQFFSWVDAIYAPVFNKDTSYYNNIIRSTVRDMHCYFVQANVAEYGWSQICQPTKHDLMQPLFVKGGINNTNQIIILSGKLEVKELRAHQKYSIMGQIARKNKFKPTPPDYDKNKVSKREKDENYLEE
ncbi:MAG: hypothetical protein MJZ77_01850 [Bacteroidales bacterium]|nr:hypothetical protein [Bacteroidales bacterium]